MKKTEDIIEILKNEMSHPQHEVWKYYIDSRDWKYGKYIYDRGHYVDGIITERGYLDKSTQAFREFVINTETVNRPLSVELLDRIHDTHITTYLSHKGSKRMDSSLLFQTNPVHVNLVDNELGNIINLSLPNLLFLTKLYRKCHHRNSSLFDNRLSSTHGVIIYDTYEKQGLDFYSFGVPKHKLTNILNEYESSIDNALTIKDRMQSTIHLIKTLECLHPWTDGNARTLCMTLLYKECVRHGIFPPLQYNPNVFDLLSIPSLVNHALNQSDKTHHHFLNKSAGRHALLPHHDMKASQIAMPMERLIFHPNLCAT